MINAKPRKPRVLFASKNKAASWEIRGRQISGMRQYWETDEIFSGEDYSAVKDFDVIHFVKYPNDKVLEKSLEYGKIISVDIVDSWPQPDCYGYVKDISDVREMFMSRWAGYGKCLGLVFPNKKMLGVFHDISNIKTYIYHHYRPDIKKTKIRERIKKIGYEGNVKYLGEWGEVIEEICSEKGWEFLRNPESLSELDLCVAARGGEHSHFMSSGYKSNVKLVNMFGAGVPAIVNADEASYHETDNGDVVFFSDKESFLRGIEKLEPFDIRKRISQSFLTHSKKFSIENISIIYDLYFSILYRRYNNV